jgi:Zn-dependent protease
MASTSWVSAIITGLLFFVSILLHELTHAAVAKLRRIPVRAITLFALGGVAQIEKDAADAKSEFWMGVIGPITSVVIGLFCLPLATVLGWNFAAEAVSPPAAILMWLGFVNIALAVFNMIPGFGDVMAQQFPTVDQIRTSRRSCRNTYCRPVIAASW